MGFNPDFDYGIIPLKAIKTTWFLFDTLSYTVF